MSLAPADVAEIREALGRPLPEVPSRYFYDAHGSALFEAITRLPEYYPSRTEEAILERYADVIVSAVRPRELVELGSGAGRKIRILLDAMGRLGRLERLVLLEISPEFLLASVERLVEGYPDLDVRGIQGDFEQDLGRLGPGGDRLVLLLAGTIGNLTPEQAGRFVGLVARQLAPGDGFLVGFDLVKDVGRLEAAYNDSQSVTAAFNRNILAVLNARFDADFVPEAFAHVAFYDRTNAWIEMRLRATRPMVVTVKRADVVLRLAAGDEIRTEISCKYTRARVSALAAVGGMTLERWLPDPGQSFALALLRPA